MIEKPGLMRHQFPSVDVAVSQSAALPAKLNIGRGMGRTGETPLEDRSLRITGSAHPVRRTPLIIRPITEVVPPSPVDI